MEHGVLFNIFIYLAAGVIAVPIAKRIGLGSVLGYLIAGVIVGPYALSLISHQQDVMHVAEFGVVMMLFLVGLELRPALLWKLKMPILGTGGLQLCATTVCIFILLQIAGLPWKTALAIGLIVALSSTAIVLQNLQERELMKTEAGKNAFAVLLFQDMAVIPILSLLPLLVIKDAAIIETATASWQSALMIAGVIIGIIIGGHFLVVPLLHVIASSRSREIFIAAALVLVVGTALAMEAVGLSAALGTFLAGVVLADSEYRHELESDIEPFKSLLLGIFFISVGASIDFALLLEQPGLVALLVTGLIVTKFIVLFITGIIFKIQRSQNWLFSCALAQGGEFAFVLTSFALQRQVFDNEIASLLVLVVTLSMVFTPLLLIINDKLIAPTFKIKKTAPKEPPKHQIPKNDSPVIIAGFGGFGQVVGRLLHGYHIDTTILENDVGQIELLQQFKYKVFYGDAEQLNLLHAAGADTARLFIIAVESTSKSKRILIRVKKHFPHLTVLVRAIDRNHAQQLIRLGADHVFRDTLDSGISLGVETLKALGMRANQAHRAGQVFRRHDEEVLHDEASRMHEHEPQYVNRSLTERQILKKLLGMDALTYYDNLNDAWSTEAHSNEEKNTVDNLAAAHKHNKTNG
ncbi:MAG: glutathione-regulated potassium-efflux system ancillary protein KefC [Moritella sp.]|jgi:glutathione-regulated potassium-efflux system ancillary protein KefC